MKESDGIVCLWIGNNVDAESYYGEFGRPSGVYEHVDFFSVKQ